jgi:hypothetical protein
MVGISTIVASVLASPAMAKGTKAQTITKEHAPGFAKPGSKNLQEGRFACYSFDIANIQNVTVSRACYTRSQHCARCAGPRISVAWTIVPLAAPRSILIPPRFESLPCSRLRVEGHQRMPYFWESCCSAPRRVSSLRRRPCLSKPAALNRQWLQHPRLCSCSCR